MSLSDLSAQHGSSAAARRLGRRRRAELRLQAYGLLAMGLAAGALIALLSTVVGNATLALTESYLEIPVELTEETVGATAEARAEASYAGLVKDSLKAMFPSVSGRQEQRQLYDVVSGGASFELRERVLESPEEMVGGEREARLLASDDVDLYLKGQFGEIDRLAHSGTLGVSGSGDEITLSSTADDFLPHLALVKEALLDEARKLRRQAARQDHGRAVRAEQAVEATGEEEREKLLKQADAYAYQRDQLLAQADELERRAARSGGEEAVGSAMPSLLIKVNGGIVKVTRVSPSSAQGKALIPLESAGEAPAEAWEAWLLREPEQGRNISDLQVAMIETLRDQGRVETAFNWRFFTSSDSREAELAGIWGALVGSFWTMLVTFALAFPVGVMAAIYLEEFAPKTKLTDFIEVNINNLAAVPSIVFGLLGLAIFVSGLEIMGVQIGGFVPRSAPLAGGIVLALMTLPTIIIASRAAIRAVPPSIRDGALALGASRLQTGAHHVLPLALPGILTGTIIGMAQALGETAPLIMIGMVAFIVDTPEGITDSATVLPVQVFRWSDFPERAFEARTAAAIMVLLAFLVAMNALAVFLRKRFERRW
ncbi:MAG: phosphate ABC transporter permease PstA [Pseudomonadota bacterium]